MRRRFLHLLPLFLAALWLPFQAIAAVSMPYCRHGETPAAATAAASVAEHCHLHAAQDGAGDHALSCDGCGFCHLACATFMPTAGSSLPMVPGAQDYRAEVPLARASAIPEPPQQPPKRLA